MSEDSKQTHLINELPYPIEIIGVPDIIVAANSDGILIANKEKSHLIKDRLSHVTKLPRHVEKRWGFYQIVRHLKDDQGQESMIKLLKMDQGSQTSYHTHDQRDESLTILSGVADILMEDKLYRLSAGGVLHIPAGSRHGIKAVSALELIEVCLGHDLAEEDIQRISMIW
ncbi:Alginate biosynthesis protein AlgA [compost metagenome]